MSADSIAPTILTFDPVVAVDANVVITFSEAIQRGTGAIILKDAAGNVIETFDAASSGRLTVSGSTLTIDPSASLAHGATYTLEIAAGAIQDVAANAYAGTTSHHFSTDDYGQTTADHGAVVVGGSVHGDLEQFSDCDWFAVELTAGSSYAFRLDAAADSSLDPFLRLYDSSGSQLLTASDNFGGNISAVINYTPQATGTYYLAASGSLLPDGAYELSAGVATPDTTPPTLRSLNPADEAVGVQVSANLVMTFDEAIRRGTGAVLLKDAAGGIVQSFDAATSTGLRLSGAMLAINPTADLAPNANYTVEVAPGAILDFQNNAYPAAISYNFRTDDYGSKSGSSGSIALGNVVPGVVDIAGDADWFGITLSAGRTYQFRVDAANGGTLDPFLTVYDSGNRQAVSDDNSGGNSNAVVSFTPSSNGTYYLAVAGSNASTGGYAISADNAPPSIRSFMPADGSQGARPEANIFLTFSEPIQRGSGTITLETSSGTAVESFDAAASDRITISGATLTLDPTADLAYGTSYRLTLPTGMVINGTGNGFVGTSTYDFSTDDYGQYFATSVALAVGASVSGNVETWYDNDWFAVSLTAGQGYLFRLAPGASGGLSDPYLAVINSGGKVVSSDDNSGGGSTAQVVFAPTSSGTYYLAARGVETATGSYQLSTSAGAVDNVAPVVEWFSPADEAMGFQVYQYLALNFSENVVRGTGTLVLQKADGTIVETFDAATSSRLYFDNTRLSVAPTAELSASTAYQLLIPSGAFLDNAGNAYAGTSTYNFTTDDYGQFASRCGTIAVNGTRMGTIDNVDDLDWFAVSLTAGRSYSFRLDAASGSGLDPYMTLRDGAGSKLALDADSGGGTSALLNYTATASGTFFVEASSAHINSGDYRLSVTDLTGPVASTFSPADEAVGVAVSANIVVNFSDPIQRGTGNILIRDAAGIVESFDMATSGRVSISGSSLTLDPTTDLRYGGGYSVEIPAGAVSDLAGIAYGGTTTYNFATDDFGQSVGANGAVSIGGSAAGVVTTEADRDWFAVTLVGGQTYTFRADPAAGSALDPMLVVRDAAGNALATDDNSGGGTSAQLTYSATASGTVYLEVASGGAASTTGSYQVAAADVSAPAALSFAPANAATGVTVASNLSVTFTEAIQRGSGSIVLKNAAGTVIESFDAATSSRVAVSGSTLILDPSADLAYATSYQVDIPAGAVIDAAGNGFAGTSSYAFTSEAAPPSTPAPTAAPSSTDTTTATTTTISAPSTTSSAESLGAALDVLVSPTTRDEVLDFLGDAAATQTTFTRYTGTTLLSTATIDGSHSIALLPPVVDMAYNLVDGAMLGRTQLPAGNGLMFSGRDAATPAEAVGYLQSFVDRYLPADSADPIAATRASLQSAIASQQSAMEARGITSAIVRFVDFSHGPTFSAAAAQELLLDTGRTAQDELLAVNLSHLGTRETVTMRGVENVVLAGAGRARIENPAGVRVTNDATTQSIIGADGNDVFVSVGGDDTLSGAGGSDTFAFAGAGHYRVTDFNAQADRLAFNFGGIDRIADLLPFLTGVEQTSEGVTYHFGAAASITLVGVQASEVGASAVAFHV